MSKKTLEPKAILIVSDDAGARADIEQVVAICMPNTIVKSINANTNYKAFLKALKPEIIVIDLNLRDADGFAVLSDIRQLSSAPIITMSYDHDQTLRIKALENDADAHLLKPFHQLEFIALVRAHLRRSKTTCE